MPSLDACQLNACQLIGSGPICVHQAPEWHALAAGLLPRGLEVAIMEMSQGASAQVTWLYMHNIMYRI